MGVIIKALVFLAVVLASSEATTWRCNGYCPWTGWEYGTPHLVKKTAQGYAMFKKMVENKANLYMAAWDPNTEEKTNFRCMRFEFDTTAKTYVLHHINKAGKKTDVKGNGEFRLTPGGASIDFHSGLGDSGVLNSGKANNIRFHIRAMNSGEIIGYTCRVKYYAWWTRYRLDNTYVLTKANTKLTLDQTCMNNIFKKYYVTSGNMKTIDLAECDRLYAAG